MALSDTDRHENKIFPQNSRTHGNGVLVYNLDNTKHSLPGKEQKIIIQLLTEKPLRKTFKKELDTEKLPLGLTEIQKPPAEKSKITWSAFRRWKEDAEGKALQKYRPPRTFTAINPLTGKLPLQTLTTKNSAKNNYFKVIDILINNISTGESITNQQAKTKIKSEKFTLGKTSTQKSTIEWAALRRLKEKVDEDPTTVTSLKDETDERTDEPYNFWQINMAKTLSTTRKHDVKNVLDEKPVAENIEIDRHNKCGMKKAIVKNIYKKPTLKKISNLKFNLIKRKVNKTPSRRYQARIKKVSQNTTDLTLQTISISTTEKSKQYTQKIPSWKVVQKLLKEKKARRKTASKKAASVKRAAPLSPPPLCWNGREVQQVPTIPPARDRNGQPKRRENGKIVYRRINNKKTPFWSIRVKDNRKTTNKRVNKRKSHPAKGKSSSKITGSRKVVRKTKRKKGKVILTRNRKESKKSSKKKKSYK